MSKLNRSELDKISQFSQKQMNVFRNNPDIVEELDKFAYSYVTAKELKVIAKVLNKIKKETEIV